MEELLPAQTKSYRAGAQVETPATRRGGHPLQRLAARQVPPESSDQVFAASAAETDMEGDLKSSQESGGRPTGTS